MNNKDKIERIVLEDYENEFFYEKSKSNLNITFNRIAFIFFVFLTICIIYSFKVFYLGSLNSKIKIKNPLPIKTNYRADIVDVNGNFVAKTINTIDILKNNLFPQYDDFNYKARFLGYIIRQLLLFFF